MKILIVDDEPLIPRLVAEMLDHGKDDIRAAANGPEALACLGKSGFDVCLLDYALGSGMNGMELMKEMRVLAPELSFIVITGNHSPLVAADFFKQGASDYLCKPFTPAELQKSLEHVQGLREREREHRRFIAELERAAREKTEALAHAHLSVLSTLVQTMEKRDCGTYGHSRRVCDYACAIAAALGLPEQERRQMRVTALLHDIGKIAITDFIIGKQGGLTQEEMEVVRTHPRIGVEILSPIRQLEPMLPGILFHHERFDGSGYPEGLSGENIPLHARIIAVADTYDAILSDRPYRSGVNHLMAMTELFSNAEKQFDPAIIHAFDRIDTAALSRMRGNGFSRQDLLGRSIGVPVCPSPVHDALQPDLFMPEPGS